MLQHKKQGFTLLEILIALFIFTLISIILTKALHDMLNIEAHLMEKSERLQQLQIALLLISRDIEQTINRPITNAMNKQEGFIGTSNMITLTHAGLTFCIR